MKTLSEVSHSKVVLLFASLTIEVLARSTIVWQLLVEAKENAETHDETKTWFVLF